MQFIKRETEPHKIKIGGNEYPAIYNFKAIKEQENYTGYAHTITTTRIAQNVFTAKDIIGVIYGMLKAGGVECTPDDIAESITLDDETELLGALVDIMNSQMPPVSEEDTSKNVAGATETIGTD